MVHAFLLIKPFYTMKTMTKIGTFFSLILLLVVNITAQNIQKQDIKTNIDEVKIHLQGAEVIRQTAVQLSNGKHQLVFHNLSPKINAQSIQVTPSEGVSILSITSKINFLKKQALVSQEVQVLQDSVDLLNIALQNLKDEENAFLQEKKLLETNQKLGSQQNNVPIEEILRAGELYRKRFASLNQQLSKLKRQQIKISQDLQERKAQLQELNAGNRPTSEIYVVVKTERSLKADFQLRYVVNDAGWSPIYDLKAGALSQPIELKYRALAFNNTGVNWENVKIKLSTADPLQRADKPHLTTWFLKENEPIAYERNLGRLNDYQQNQAGNEKDLLDRLPNNDVQGGIRYETIEISELNNEFNITEPYSIPADRKPYSIDITEHQLKASYQHYCVPKVDKDAFLLAQITGWQQLELIAGPINIYRNNSYVGLANLDTRNLNDTLDLSLGRDENVLVKRVKEEELSKKQFLGSNKKWTVAYKITVQNNHSLPITMELEDQVPVSNNKDISVDVQETSGATLFEKTGKLRWTFQLKPRESRSFNIGFSIKYPKNKEIVLEKTRTTVTPRYF